MSNRHILPSGLLVALAAFSIIVSASACSESNFAGGGPKRSLNLNDKSDANDGGGGRDSDSDGDSDNDGGSEGKGGKDGKDGDSDGSDGMGGKDGLDGSDSGDSDGLEGSDSGDTDNGDSDVGDDGGTVTKKTRSDLKIRQTREDDKHRIKVELLIKGKVSKTEEVASPGKGKEIVMTDMCRKNLDTCLKVTFIGKLTQTAGGAQCVFTSPQGATSVKIDVDTNGAGFLGSCKPDEDETLFFECPDSKSLKVQGCNG
jgi:hypothetical protein